jgi:hypothetical protein
MAEHPGTTWPWFVAMEYCFLIWNRTYKVFVTDTALCGAKVSGVIASPRAGSPVMLDPTAWINTRAAERYDGMDLMSEHFLKSNSANFRIGWADILRIEHRTDPKWGMGNVPYSGRLMIHLRTERPRELILLGKQYGGVLKDEIDRVRDGNSVRE